MNPAIVGGLTIKYRRLRPKWQCYFPLPFISDGYKYILEETYAIMTGIIPPDGTVEWISQSSKIVRIRLDETGLLTIFADYCWDGASGPTIDSEDNMRGGLVHDSLYQILRAKLIPMKPNKEIADRLLVQCCRENGMGEFRGNYYYQGVHLFGRFGMNCKEPMSKVETTRPK